MSGAAPAEIADDLEILAEAYAAFAAALEDAGVDFSDPGSLSSPEAQAALASAGEAFASSDVEEASNNISEYMDEVCEDSSSQESLARNSVRKLLGTMAVDPS